MSSHHPFQIIGYHSCDRKIGLDALSGRINLTSSENDWDWLGGGIYFWEQEPFRALNYAVEVAQKTQFNKTGIETPFVLGAIIELGHCLNLVESQSLQILKEAHLGLTKMYKELDKKIPVNKESNRKLDCAVIRYVHQSRKENNEIAYETIRSAFDEGEKVYEGANFTARHHIQVCVINEALIKGYFLPRPLQQFNPYLFKDFVRE